MTDFFKNLATRAIGIAEEVTDKIDELDLDEKDIERYTMTLNLFVSTGFALDRAIRGRRAVRAGEWNKATYYAVMLLVSAQSTSKLVEDMRRKGHLPPNA